MAGLMVNVDHVATVRQARGIDEPDPVLAASLAELAGCDGIIVHLREDRRHIQDRDLEILRRTIKTRLNLEMASVPEMVRIAQEIKPEMVSPLFVTTIPFLYSDCPCILVRKPVVINNNSSNVLFI